MLTRRQGRFVHLTGKFSFRLSQLAQFFLPTPLQTASHQAVVGVAAMERAFCARGFVAGALDPQLQGAIAVAPARRDLVGRGQRQRDLFGREHLEQTRANLSIDYLSHNRTTLRCSNVVGAAARAIVDRLAATIHGGHWAPTAAAHHDPLQQPTSFTDWTRTLRRTVGDQTLDVAQKAVPGDVGGMMITD